MVSDALPSNLASREAAVGTYITEQRRRDFDRAVVPFLVVLATAVIWVCIFKDAARVGYRWDWIVIRLAYLPFVLAIVAIWRRLKERATLFAELPVMACGAYISAFCGYFATANGGLASDYVYGVLQFLLGIAIMPIATATFSLAALAVTGTYFGIVVLTGTRPLGHAGYAISNYLSFMVFSGLIFAITSRIRNRRAELQHKLEEVIRMAVHDIRKPLDLVKAVASSLPAINDQDDARRLAASWTPVLAKAHRDAELIISEMLDAGSPPSILAVPVDLQALLQEALSELQATERGSPLNIKIDVAGDLRTSGDPGKLKRALANLLQNAHDAAGVGGRIWVRAARHLRYSAITIGNSGKTIPPEVLGRVFEPFFTAGKRRGTGLGLAIVNNIVRAHAGQVWCTSTEAEGTQFHVLLPTQTTC